MRIWRLLTAASLLGAGAVAMACSSSSSGGGGTTEAGTEGGGDDGGGGEAAACTPNSMTVSTVDGGSQWACYNGAAVCGMQLMACSSDCACNNAVLAALNCIVDAGGQTVSMSVKTQCFTAQLNAASGSAAVAPLITCLMGVGSTMCALTDEGGTEGGSEGGGHEGGSSEGGADGGAG